MSSAIDPAKADAPLPQHGIVQSTWAHLIALRVFLSQHLGIVSQIPMLVLMVVYTCVGLWVLSLPLPAPQVIPIGLRCQSLVLGRWSSAPVAHGRRSSLILSLRDTTNTDRFRKRWVVAMRTRGKAIGLVAAVGPSWSTLHRTVRV